MADWVKKTDAAVDACLTNAERLLAAAKAADVPGSTHISFHLAGLALEEVGLASMIVISAMPMRKPQTREGEEEDEEGPLAWSDDHERKLFWALWLRRFDFGDSWKQIASSLQTAKWIHEKRKATLYVNPRTLGSVEVVTREQLDAILGLAGVHVAEAKASKVRELEGQDLADLEWFYAASVHPEHKRLIYSPAALEKQKDFPGGVEWVRWLREQIEEGEREAQELVRRELSRQEPTGNDRLKDKWQLKLRVQSWSHSIRPKPLKAWNERVDKFKLYPVTGKRELAVHCFLPLQLPVAGVWTAGYFMANLFMMSLNIGTMGFFWWYVPQYISRFYESITDLESRHHLVLERTPELKIEWGNRALNHRDMEITAIVFAFASQAEGPQRFAFDHYFRGLALMAKNDIFLRFEGSIGESMYHAMRAGFHGYGEWDGKEETLEVSVVKFYADLNCDEGFLEMVKAMMKVGAECAERKPEREVALEDVGRLKACFEMFVQQKAIRFAHSAKDRKMASQNSQPRDVAATRFCRSLCKAILSV